MMGHCLWADPYQYGVLKKALVWLDRAYICIVVHEDGQEPTCENELCVHS